MLYTSDCMSMWCGNRCRSRPPTGITTAIGATNATHILNNKASLIGYVSFAAAPMPGSHTDAGSVGTDRCLLLQ